MYIFNYYIAFIYCLKDCSMTNHPWVENSSVQAFPTAPSITNLICSPHLSISIRCFESIHESARAMILPSSTSSRAGGCFSIFATWIWHRWPMTNCMMRMKFRGRVCFHISPSCSIKTTKPYETLSAKLSSDGFGLFLDTLCRCSHCQRFAPEWAKLAEKVMSQSQYVFLGCGNMTVGICWKHVGTMLEPCWNHVNVLWLFASEIHIQVHGSGPGGTAMKFPDRDGVEREVRLIKCGNSVKLQIVEA